jgi:hypothetical protein
MDPDQLVESPDFAGKTFQQAQEKIVVELMRHQEEYGWLTDLEASLLTFLNSEMEIFFPFVVLPPRSLTDYYQVITHPVSLTSMRKKTRGAQGRGPATGISDFKTWDAFANEMSFIWRNAQEYNEDGSDIFVLADEFKVNTHSWVRPV